MTPLAAVFLLSVLCGILSLSFTIYHLYLHPSPFHAPNLRSKSLQPSQTNLHNVATSSGPVPPPTKLSNGKTGQMTYPAGKSTSPTSPDLIPPPLPTPIPLHIVPPGKISAPIRMGLQRQKSKRLLSQRSPGPKNSGRCWQEYL